MQTNQFTHINSLPNNILSGFKKGNQNETEQIEKSVVHEHQRKSKSGKLSNVKQYEDSRQQHQKDDKSESDIHIDEMLKKRENFYKKVGSFDEKDVENIIFNNRYFKGENVSRAHVVLKGLREAKGDMDKFEKTDAGRLYLRMNSKEKSKIHSAVQKYFNDKKQGIHKNHEDDDYGNQDEVMRVADKVLHDPKYKSIFQQYVKSGYKIMSLDKKDKTDYTKIADNAK